MRVYVLGQLVLASVFLTGIHLLVPRLALGGVLFGVTVAEGFASTPQGAAVVRRYRVHVLAAGLAAPIAIALAARSGAVNAAGSALLVQAFLCTGAWVAARARTRPHAVAPSTLRRAGLAPEGGGSPLLRALPFLLLALAAVVAAAAFDRYPARFALHWNGAGIADRWADRSPRAVFEPLLHGAVLCLLLAGVRAATLAFSPKRPGDARAAALRRFLQVVMDATGIFMAVLFSAIALGPLVTEGPGLVIAVAGTGIAALVPALAIAAARFASIPTAGPGDGTPDDRWRWGGLFYVNPEDPAVFVPKRAGLGYTVNLGRPAGVLALVAMLAVPLALALLSALGGR